MRFNFRLLLVLVCLVASPALMAANLAIIIDDMGNSSRDARAFALPKDVAFSILPHTAFSSDYARRAAKQEREVMLHIPMESLTGKALGPGALTSNMHPNIIVSVLDEALQSVPNAIGVNNHMGSKLTQLTLPMQTTMDMLARRNLFFVDSRTTRFSKALKIAEKQGVPATERQVFLDHSRKRAHMKSQFNRLLAQARRNGFALGIGHPYPQTVSFLEQALGSLENSDIQLIPISELVRGQYLTKQARHDGATSPQAQLHD